MIRRHAALLALLGVVALHVALVLHFVPPHVVLGPEPLVGLDYDLHYQESLRAVEAFRKSGRVWCYDPHLLAGQLSGTIFDADNKLVEALVIVLTSLGVSLHRAYNLCIWLLHLPLPLVMYGSARWMGSGRAASILAGWLGSMLWFFDSFNHFAFFVGAISWASAQFFWLLPLALFYRWTVTRRWWLLGLEALVLALTLKLHPYTFFCLVLPMAWLYWRARSELDRWQHLGVWGVAVVAVVANAWWLLPAVRFWHYALDSSFFLDATPAYLLYDFLGVLKAVDIQGVTAVRTSFRFATFVAAVLGLVLWRRSGDDRFRFMAASLGLMMLVAHIGAWITPLRQVQPFRFLGPSMFLAALPAAEWLVGAVASVRTTKLSPAVQGLFAVVSVVAVSKLARDVLYFFPGWVPMPRIGGPAPLPNVNQDPAYGAAVWPPPFYMRQSAITPIERPIIAFVNHHDDGRGRWLVEWQNVGERLAWASNAQVIGGFRVINLAHSDSNLLRKYPSGVPPEPGELERYLERYNVQWVVLTFPLPGLERRTDLLQFVVDVGGHRVYRTRAEPSWFVDGGPGTVQAEVDQLTVRGSRGGDRVLKYHYLETLECRPGCELYRVPVEGNRVGFIGVRHAPPDFEIVNP